MGSAPESPDLPAAPTIGNTYIYDEEGNLSGSIVRDSAGNSIYKPKQLTGEELANKREIETKKTSLLQRLYQTPAEYTTAAEEEAQAYATRTSNTQREQFTKDVNRIGEVSNVRGLLGSSAYRDIMSNREETQSKTEAEIAQNATSMRQSLIDAKKQQDYNLYNIYAGASNDYTNKNMSYLNAASGLYGQTSATAQNAYNSQVNAINTQYQNQMSSWQANEPWRNYIIPTATAAGSIIGALSDRRLKKNITPLGPKINGVQLYFFEYSLEKWPDGVLGPTPGIHIGVMADEVRDIPGAVEPEMFYGFDMVNYEVIRRHIGMENA